MQCINRILILADQEKAALEAAIGPIKSYNVDDVRLKLVIEIEKKEAAGQQLWATMLRITLRNVTAFSSSNV
ncbi:MAG TPA: hypothetical protein VFF81_12185 [Noviherbaspirillum sp.]|nr:hypothetical protein [Noviherbaspirillum sp.]